MELTIKLSLIEQLCKNIAFQVQWLSGQEETKTKQDVDETSEEDQHAVILRMLKLSKQVMEYVDLDVASKLSSDKLDEIIRVSLVGLYRLPLVAQRFESETLDFYNWWCRHIRNWSSHSNPLSRSHLKAMIAETKDHLLPQSKRSYRLTRRSPNAKVRYYSARCLSYSKVSPLGRALGSSLSHFATFPSPFTGQHGNALWFLKELNSENEDDGEPTPRVHPHVHDVEYSPLGIALGSCLNNFTVFPGPINVTRNHANELWCLKELEDQDEEIQKSARVHDIDHVYVLPQPEQRKRTRDLISEALDIVGNLHEIEDSLEMYIPSSLLGCTDSQGSKRRQTDRNGSK